MLDADDADDPDAHMARSHIALYLCLENPTTDEGGAGASVAAASAAAASTVDPNSDGLSTVEVISSGDAPINSQHAEPSWVAPSRVHPRQTQFELQVLNPAHLALHNAQAANVDIGVIRTWSVKCVLFSSELRTWGHPRFQEVSGTPPRHICMQPPSLSLTLRFPR